jgi:4-hydroxy-4-methyl-2-oxoglutarate aldolase
MTTPTIHRVDPELVEAYRGVSPSIIGHWHRVRFMDHGIKPLLPGTFLVGPAVTIRAPHMDIAGLRGLMDAAQPGDVIVVDQVGEREHACVGEFRALFSIRAGHAGFVIDGAVCDVVELRRMGYPVFTRTVSALVGKPLDVDGEVQRPIVCGGVVVHPGELIVADDNGVCVLSETEARDLLPKVRAALEREAGMREGFAEEYRRFARGEQSR